MCIINILKLTWTPSSHSYVPQYGVASSNYTTYPKEWWMGKGNGTAIPSPSCPENILHKQALLKITQR